MFAWQGWCITLPEECEPVSVGGGYASGHALLADLFGPRQGIRWQSVGRRIDVRQAMLKEMRQEVGQLAASEARWLRAEDGGQWLCYGEASLPGRHVCVGFDQETGRTVTVVQHATTGAHAVGQVVPADLICEPANQPQPWAVFDLSCHVPPQWQLAEHELMAGDLRLRFTQERNTLLVRQIAAADVALRRMPLQRWLEGQLKAANLSAIAAPQAVQMLACDGRSLDGIQATARPRRSLLRGTGRELTLLALHDRQRNKLLLVESNQPELAQAVACSSGWAEAEVASCGH